MVCVNSVNVYPSKVTLQTGSWYYGAWAEVCPTYAECTDVSWYSDNPSVASVNATSGYIYARSAGSTRIYACATDGSGISDYITVTVTSKVSVTSVTLNRTSLSLERGDYFALTATVCPENATNRELCWRSTNTNVAEVNSGVVTAKASGYAYIYAEATDGSGVYARCYVHVTQDVLVTSVTVSPSNLTMTAGESTYLHAVVCPENATNKCVTWSSCEPNVATVNPVSGLVYAQSTGTTVIYATAQDGSGSCGTCSVTVTSVAVDSVCVCPKQKFLSAGETTTLSVIICPNNASNKSVIWTSSDTSIVTVGTYTGIVTAKAKGTATITARTVSENKTDTCTITVDSWEKVIVEKDVDNNCCRIVFKNGKSWNCINKDIINDYILDKDDPLTYLFYDNVYENKVLEGVTGYPQYFEPLKEYTEEEMKLIYTIDPLGFAGYVDKYAEKEFRNGENTQEMLGNLLEYKDSIFYLLFNRQPRYYRRDLSGSWHETTDKSDLQKVLSESEFLFGWHVIYDGFTLIEFLSAVADILSILVLCPALKALTPISMLNKLGGYYALARAVTESVLNEDFRGFVTAVASGYIDEDNLNDDFIVDTDYKTRNYSMCWAIGLLNALSLSDNLNALADTFNSGPHFYKEIFAMCENDIKYDIVIRTTDNELVPLSDINDLIQ